ncbi:hypothetical protein Agub_g13299, partial [Astrephomene gubernaculifera]
GNGGCGGGGQQQQQQGVAVVVRTKLGRRLYDNRALDLPCSTSEWLFEHLLGRKGQQEREQGQQQLQQQGCGFEMHGGGGGSGGAGAAAMPVATTGGSSTVVTAAAAAATAIQGVGITLIPEDWPESRFQVELRYRFPKLMGLLQPPTTAITPTAATTTYLGALAPVTAAALPPPFSSSTTVVHSPLPYATLSAEVRGAIALYGAEAGDVLELWQLPGGRPEEFMFRVVRAGGRGAGRGRGRG